MNARFERSSAAGAVPSVRDAVIAGIRARLAGSASLIVNGERGFRRIGARLAQHIDASPPRVHQGAWTTRVTSRVTVLHDAQVEAGSVVPILARLNDRSDACRYVFDPASRTVYSHQHAIVHTVSQAWWTPLLATSFLLQLQRADEDADAFARQLGGRVASAGSPHILKFRRHVRPTPRLVSGPQSADQRGNRFRSVAEFAAIAEYASRSNAVSARVTAAGIEIEEPFGRETARVRLATDVDHPRAGPGLSVSLQLPVGGRFETVAHIAAGLNRREAAGDVFAHGLGAWTARGTGERAGLCHNFFVPKDAWAAGLALHLAAATLTKLERISEILAPRAA